MYYLNNYTIYWQQGVHFIQHSQTFLYSAVQSASVDVNNDPQSQLTADI